MKQNKEALNTFFCFLCLEACLQGRVHTVKNNVKKRRQNSLIVPTNPSVQRGSPADLANLEGLSVFILALKGVFSPRGLESSSLCFGKGIPKADV